MNKSIMCAVGFEKEVNMVELSRCPFCGERVIPGSFKDEISEREFRISGLCQSCQDDTFTTIRIEA